jgi:hypothetical protein
MATHWTYGEFAPEDDLEQGDILLPNAALREVFDEVHQHFLADKYLAFIVLTQTCDLVRRKGRPCRSRYVTLGAVRRLADILPSLLNSVCRQVAPGYFEKESKAQARELLARLFNQNEQGLGLFYLHEDADVGIGEPSVALLQVSIALRAQEHYDTLVKTRHGRLRHEFQAKLGWLTGNLYSRVATPDWRAKQLDKMVRAYLGSDWSAPGPKWVPRAWCENARKQGVDPATLEPEALDAALQRYRPPSPKDVVINEMVRVLQDLDAAQTEETLTKFRNRLANNPVVSEALRVK